MKKIFCIIGLIYMVGGICGQNDMSVIRTPKDYVFCAEGAYNRKSKEQTSDTIPQRPEYLKKLTRADLSVLNKSGFYEDFITGYTGAVFIDTRDSTIIIAHRGSESSDIRDFVADAQIAGSDILSKMPAGIAEKIRPIKTLNEMFEVGLQYPSAKRFVEAIKQQFPQNEIEQTGHSLGGNTAQLLSYEFGTKGVTFDPAGIGNKISLDTAKMENAEKITNYKVHQSLISAPIATGKNIGKIIIIYPTDGEKINATKAHGLFEIYTQALNHNTGYFKTFDEVAQELWENNGTVSEIALTEKLKPAKVQTNIQDKFASYSEYKEYLKRIYNITEQ